MLPELPGVASAVAVESIHAGWDAAAGQYREVPQDDRDWLKGHLDALRAQGMPIVAIDYLPPERRDERARSLRACVAKATCRSSAPRRWTTWG